QRTSPEESAAYIRSRARGSQLSALSSPQSQSMTSRDALEERVSEIAKRHEGGELPIPDWWGGLRVSPVSYEFWQHREDRLHDRLRYTPATGGGWEIVRLAP
ncbi:MAG TPA: pyridoxine 5'-phosphate oxidase C-terminal domain-containing protein, partial [Solirubrobacteraceae bacterium]